MGQGSHAPHPRRRCPNIQPCDREHERAAGEVDKRQAPDCRDDGGKRGADRHTRRLRAVAQTVQDAQMRPLIGVG